MILNHTPGFVLIDLISVQYFFQPYRQYCSCLISFDIRNEPKLFDYQETVLIIFYSQSSSTSAVNSRDLLPAHITVQWRCSECFYYPSIYPIIRCAARIELRPKVAIGERVPYKQRRGQWPNWREGRFGYVSPHLTRIAARSTLQLRFIAPTSPSPCVVSCYHSRCLRRMTQQHLYVCDVWYIRA